MKDTYAKAVLDLLDAGTDATRVLNGLKDVLEKRGHMRLYAPVLRSVLRHLEARTIATRPVISVSRKNDLARNKSAIEAALKQLGTEQDYETKIDDSLIGGFVLTTSGQELDRSYKSALIRLYRQITAA